MATTKTTAEKIKDAEARAEKAALKVKALKTQQSHQERRLESKRRIILGGRLLAEKPDLAQDIVSKLDRKQDIEAFAGWTPKSVSVPGQVHAGAEAPQ